MKTRTQIFSAPDVMHVVCVCVGDINCALTKRKQMRSDLKFKSEIFIKIKRYNFFFVVVVVSIIFLTFLSFFFFSFKIVCEVPGEKLFIGCNKIVGILRGAGPNVCLYSFAQSVCLAIPFPHLQHQIAVGEWPSRRELKPKLHHT